MCDLSVFGRLWLIFFFLCLVVIVVQVQDRNETLEKNLFPPQASVSPVFKFLAGNVDEVKKAISTLGSIKHEALDDEEETSVFDDDGGVRTNADLIRRGPGEENETTLFELEKAKFFKLTDGNWVDVGVGPTKINKDNTRGKRRLLARAEGSGRVLLNASLFPEMLVFRPEGKKDVMITTVEGGKPQKFLLRCKTQEEATSLHTALNKHKMN